MPAAQQKAQTGRSPSSSPKRAAAEARRLLSGSEASTCPGSSCPQHPLWTEPQNDDGKGKDNGLCNDLSGDECKQSFGAAYQEAADQCAGQDLADSTDDNDEEGTDQKDVPDVWVDTQHGTDQRAGEPGEKRPADEHDFVGQPHVETEQAGHLGVLHESPDLNTER